MEEFQFDENQLNLGHLLLNARKCRTCGETKNLINDFYRTHKERGAVASSYSHECKECTKSRILKSRKKVCDRWEYPDW